VVWSSRREYPRLGVRGVEDVQDCVVCVEGLSEGCCTGALCAVTEAIYHVISYGLASMPHVHQDVGMIVAHI
jgi:hypothetical protein